MKMINYVFNKQLNFIHIILLKIMKILIQLLIILIKIK